MYCIAFCSCVEIEELRNAVGPNNAIKLITASRSMTMPLHREAMKDCFSGLMESHKETVKAELNSLVGRVHDMSEYKEEEEGGELLCIGQFSQAGLH